MGNKNGISLKLFNNSIFKTRSHTQTEYVGSILENHITFGLGAAGSGKTFCAVATALNLFSDKQVKKIILTRPAIEAGENLGFLPGTLEEKIMPYLFPLFDSLDELIGSKKREELITKGVLEILPLAYMRGRSLNDSIIILDEAQNTSKIQMKMVLTRLGNGSRIVVNGDESQNDLPKHIDSGLIDAVSRLKKYKGIGVTNFLTSDVVRHPIVKTVIEAYQD